MLAIHFIILILFVPYNNVEFNGVCMFNYANWNNVCRDSQQDNRNLNVIWSIQLDNFNRQNVTALLRHKS